MNNNWIFNINNIFQDNKFDQIASLTNTERLKNVYINNLISTNDTSSSSVKILNSIWFKIMAYKSTDIGSKDDDRIEIQYQLIITTPLTNQAVAPFYKKFEEN